MWCEEGKKEHRRERREGETIDGKEKEHCDEKKEVERIKGNNGKLKIKWIMKNERNPILEEW